MSLAKFTALLIFILILCSYVVTSSLLISLWLAVIELLQARWLLGLLCYRGIFRLCWLGDSLRFACTTETQFPVALP